MGSITIDNLSDAYKVPRFVGDTVYGAGPINLKTIPLTLLLVGQKSASGSMTPDVDIVECTSADDADASAGGGSELARMAYAAIAERKGYRLLLMAAAPNPAALAATATIFLNGTTLSVGTLTYFIAGKGYPVAIPSGTQPQPAATLIAARINGDSRAPVTAAANGASVVLTHKCPGVRGNDVIVYQSILGKPAGMTSTLTGGAAVTSTALVTGVRMAGGFGVEDFTNVLAALFTGRFHRIALAANDPVSLAAWETQLDAKADPLQGRTEHMVVGHTGTLSAVTSLAQGTLNNRRVQLMWLKNGETPPAEMAAAMGAVRAASESSQPNTAYDGYVLKTVAPQRFQSDWANDGTQQACLDSGVTPLLSSAGGTVSCIRSVTSHSLDGAIPDYRTLDTYEAWTPDWVRDDTEAYWTTDFRRDNEYVRPDPGDGENGVPEGVATPSLWSAKLYHRFLGHEAAKILTQVALHPPESEYNYAANRIMTKTEVIPLPHQHQIGVKILQLNVAA